ncbi:spindle assembly abnormal protein 6 homolog [Ctenocephalides felis]|uniref:spindle assembly abnormal protein 6 homolog n=1 Tax=Ctenocephalides felis TaxID=7515 RepID=UPI000E6E2F2D|nr:spindle assembly abnormal protein 6 homolog [Ctenocephalides felis]
MIEISNMLCDRLFKDSSSTNKFHEGIYKIYYKLLTEEGHKDVKICIDHTTCTTMKLSVIDDRDPRFMFSLDLNREDYSILQTQQSILVPFESFPKQVVRLLEECARGDMLLQLLQTGQLEWCLQFVVRNEFKSLIHLQLLIGRASDSDLINFMSNKINQLTHDLNKAHQSLLTKEDNYRRILDQRDLDLQNLRKCVESTKMDLKKAESEHKKELAASLEHVSKERDKWQREQDNRYELKINDLQSEIQRKKSDFDMLKSELNSKSDKIFSLEITIRDLNNRVKSLEQELNSSRLQQSSLQNDLSRFQRELSEKESQIQNHKTRIVGLERTLVIKDEQLSKANTSLTSCQQNIAEAESKVTDCMVKLNNKREALHQTSQDLSKANEIITKQNEQIVALKEKVKFRTAVAFEQEKVIDQLQSHNDKLQAENKDMSMRLKEISNKNTEYSKELDDLKIKLLDKEKTIEYNNTMINWMQKRINDTSDSTIPNMTARFGNTALKNNPSTSFKPCTLFPLRSTVIQGERENGSTSRNIGELSPDLLLPDDINEKVKPSNVTEPKPMTLQSRLNTDRSAKTVTTITTNTNRTKASKTQRKTSGKPFSTPSNYFNDVT